MCGQADVATKTSERKLLNANRRSNAAEPEGSMAAVRAELAGMAGSGWLLLYSGSGAARREAGLRVQGMRTAHVLFCLFQTFAERVTAA
ncbi:unnamed protein product [Arctogadus glacialis]